MQILLAACNLKTFPWFQSTFLVNNWIISKTRRCRYQFQLKGGLIPWLRKRNIAAYHTKKPVWFVWKGKIACKCSSNADTGNSRQQTNQNLGALTFLSRIWSSSTKSSLLFFLRRSQLAVFAFKRFGLGRFTFWGLFLSMTFFASFFISSSFVTIVKNEPIKTQMNRTLITPWSFPRRNNGINKQLNFTYGRPTMKIC